MTASTEEAAKIPMTILYSSVFGLDKITSSFNKKNGYQKCRNCLVLLDFNKSDLLALPWLFVHLRGEFPLFERGLDTGLARQTLSCHHHSFSAYSLDDNHHQRYLQTYHRKNQIVKAFLVFETKLNRTSVWM